jgi:RimJ/RimL family protein N-acetyltransferase
VGQGRTVQAPTLTDGTVTLRAHRPGDVDAVLKLVSDPLNVRWTRLPAPYTRQMAREWVASRSRAWAGDGERTFAVEVGGRLAGQVGLRPDSAGAADIGYLLAPWARGRHLMSGAVRLALQWGFAEAGLEVVHWRSYVGNWASRRVAWACGFTVEGRVRALEDQRGERRDSWIGSILPGQDMSPGSPWFDVPALSGGGVVLRRHLDDDVVRIAQACRAPSTQAWLPLLPSPYTLVEAVGYVAGREEEHASGHGIYWAIADPDDDRLLGAIALMGMSRHSVGAEIGYWVHPDSRGRGAGTTATRLVARHALLPAEEGGCGLTRVLLRVADGNDASRRVAEKAGFTLVGRDRAAERLRDGRLADFLRYDLLASDLSRDPTQG